MKDERVVYAARCTWWDLVGNAARRADMGIPCCPHCGSVLFEVASLEEWWEGAEQAELTGSIGWQDFLEWLQGKCRPTMDEARAEYEAQRA